MSDEGLMTEDIEDCLSVVIQSLTKCDVPADEIIAWCKTISASDRTGFIAEERIEALRRHVETGAAH